MKILAFLSKATLVFFISVVFITCDILPESTSECNDTDAPEILVSLKATVHIRDKNNLPSQNHTIYVLFAKTACGENAKGTIEREGLSNAQGNYDTNAVFYSLRNKKDHVSVSIQVSGLGTFPDRDVETREYFYEDFIVGTTKVVDITMYKRY